MSIILLLSSSLEPSVLESRYEELKNKLREELRAELLVIDGSEDADGKAPRKSGKKRPADTTDYFQLVYECVATRTTFLNVVSLDARNLVEPDIDLAILRALLNGKHQNRLLSSRRSILFDVFQQHRATIQANQIANENVNNSV